MAKRIGFLIISAAIIVIGIIAFNRLHYWERSVQIFAMNNGQAFGRGFDWHRGDFNNSDRRGRFEAFGDRLERQNFRNLPDSTRQRINAEREVSISSDSLREGRLRTFPSEREDFRNHSFDRGRRHGRGNFHRGNQIQLTNVTWFLAVFALFTAVTIYLDKGRKFIRTKNRSKNTT